MKRTVLVLIGCLLLMGFALPGCPDDDPGVTFPDANLEAAIREALNKPEGAIDASELAALTSLSADDRGIENLSGLEHCINLEVLYLYRNQISDISPLAGLANLTRLYLSDNQISDTSALGELTDLTMLSLSRNQISDISHLTDLTSLTGLFLGENQINDISHLAHLTNLTHLDLGANQISDISPLVANEGLGTGGAVYLRENPLSSDSINIYIPELEARGVTVYY